MRFFSVRHQEMYGAMVAELLKFADLGKDSRDWLLSKDCHNLSARDAERIDAIYTKYLAQKVLE